MASSSVENSAVSTSGTASNLKVENQEDNTGRGAECGAENNLSKEYALKLVTGFLTDSGESSTSSTFYNGKAPESGTLDWTMWQLLDSLFPTGGFAHSYGLEASVQAGSVYDSETLERFLLNSLQNNAALLLPFVFAGTRLPNTECWLQLNRLLNATLTNHVARRASLTQGTALLRTCGTVFTELPELKKMKLCVFKPVCTTPHHAPLFGVLCGLLGVSELTAQRSYLFLALRDILSAGTRLNITGPMEAARLQRKVAFETETLLGKYANKPLQQAHQTSPLLEIFQAGHDQLFSRMFCS
ncbi:unnamed protein product [Calypogeia fissa]